MMNETAKKKAERLAELMSRLDLDSAIKVGKAVRETGAGIKWFHGDYSLRRSPSPGQFPAKEYHFNDFPYGQRVGIETPDCGDTVTDADGTWVCAHVWHYHQSMAAGILILYVRVA